MKKEQRIVRQFSSWCHLYLNCSFISLLYPIFNQNLFVKYFSVCHTNTLPTAPSQQHKGILHFMFNVLFYTFYSKKKIITVFLIYSNLEHVPHTSVEENNCSYVSVINFLKTRLASNVNYTILGNVLHKQCPYCLKQL